MHYYDYQLFKVHKLSIVHTLEKDIILKLLHWTMLNVMEVKQHCSSVVITGYSDITVPTMKMLVLDVEAKKKDWRMMIL